MSKFDDRLKEAEDAGKALGNMLERKECEGDVFERAGLGFAAEAPFEKFKLRPIVSERKVMDSESLIEQMRFLIQTAEKKLQELDALPWRPPLQTKVPPWARHAAVDKDGRGFYFQNKPVTIPEDSESRWYAVSGACMLMGLFEIPEGVDWRSLSWKIPKNGR
jgi:hypothetical protein